MYLSAHIRPALDKEIESLAQAVSKNGRVSGTYAVETVLSYAIAKLLTRVCKMRGLSLPQAVGSLETIKLEFYRKVAAAQNDRERNLNGDVFAEMM